MHLTYAHAHWHHLKPPSVGSRDMQPQGRATRGWPGERGAFQAFKLFKRRATSVCVLVTPHSQGIIFDMFSMETLGRESPLQSLPFHSMTHHSSETAGLNIQFFSLFSRFYR